MPTFNFCPVCARPLQDRVDNEGRRRRGCSSSDCTFVHYDNPTPVVAALVEHDGHVVLVRSQGWPESWFGLVTGFLEHGESPEAGVLREVKEELGIDGSIVRLIGLYSFAEMNQLIIAYHVRASGEIALGAELAAFKQIPPEKLRPWPMGTGKAVADWLATRTAT